MNSNGKVYRNSIQAERRAGRVSLTPSCGTPSCASCLCERKSLQSWVPPTALHPHCMGGSSRGPVCPGRTGHRDCTLLGWYLGESPDMLLVHLPWLEERQRRPHVPVLLAGSGTWERGELMVSPSSQSSVTWLLDWVWGHIPRWECGLGAWPGRAVNLHREPKGERGDS